MTDDEARKNWEKYGNPDGPGAMSFGIALPSWIVEKENSVWVLGLYALVFMVALPVVVSIVDVYYHLQMLACYLIDIGVVPKSFLCLILKYYFNLSTGWYMVVS